MSGVSTPDKQDGGPLRLGFFMDGKAAAIRMSKQTIRTKQSRCQYRPFESPGRRALRGKPLMSPARFPFVLGAENVTNRVLTQAGFDELAAIPDRHPTITRKFYIEWRHKAATFNEPYGRRVEEQSDHISDESWG